MKIKIKKLHKSEFYNIKIPQRFQHNPPKPEKVVEKCEDCGFCEVTCNG